MYTKDKFFIGGENVNRFMAFNMRQVKGRGYFKLYGGHNPLCDEVIEATLCQLAVCHNFVIAATRQTQTVSSTDF
jgi:hypothetical protein